MNEEVILIVVEGEVEEHGLYDGQVLITAQEDVHGLEQAFEEINVLELELLGKQLTDLLVKQVLCELELQVRGLGDQFQII